MAYTLSQGIDQGGMDKVQRGLLIGLPAIALILSFGALKHRHDFTARDSGAKLIPVVATLKRGNGSGGSASGSNSGDTAANSSFGSGTTSTAGGGTSTSSTASSGSSTTVGGMGGGATGGGILPVNETLYVPPLDVQAGDKSLVNSSGTTVNLN